MNSQERKYLIDRGFDVKSLFDAETVEIIMKDYLEVQTKYRESDYFHPVWIPKLFEKVMFCSDLWRIMKVDMGGKCTIRRVNQKGTKGGQLKDVDITELKAL